MSPDSLETTPIALIAGVDTVLLESATTDLLFDCPDLVVLKHRLLPESGHLQRIIVDQTGILEFEEIALEHPCASCAIREDAIPTLERLIATGRWERILFALPIAADLPVMARALDGAVKDGILAATTTVLSAEAARHDILGDDTLAERGLNIADGDERSVGEALCRQLEYADLLVVADFDIEEGLAGSELIEHLRCHDTLRVDGIHNLNADMLFSARHQVESAGHRVDPRHVCAWGGGTEYGTWTLDLNSDRPFHPERLFANIERLGTGLIRSKGRFWVPTRPNTICQWDGAGGQVSIGSYAFTEKDLPNIRLVFTGIDSRDMPRICKAFEDSLVTEAEWQEGLLAWMDFDDQLEPWLGARIGQQ